MNFRLKALTLVASATIVSQIASADVVFNFDTLVTGQLPGGSNWATLTIQDSGLDQVTMTLSHNLTSVEPQFLTELWLNLSVIPLDLAASFGAPIESIEWGLDAFTNAGNMFDVNVNLLTDVSNRLGVGDSVVWTMTGTGLDSTDFYFESSPKGGNDPVFGMVHIQGIEGGGSGKAAPVPEPASMAALGLGIAGIVARRRRK